MNEDDRKESGRIFVNRGGNDGDSIISMLDMMTMLKHPSLPKHVTIQQGENDKSIDSDMAQGIQQIEHHRESLNIQFGNEAKEACEVSMKIVGLSDLPLYLYCEKSQHETSNGNITSGSDQHLPPEWDGKTTGTNSTDVTGLALSSSSSAPSSHSTVKNTRRSCRFKCTMVIAIMLGLMLICGVIALGSILYDMKTDGNDAKDFFSQLMFWDGDP